MLAKRPRRLRKNTALRELVAETRISRDDFIMPLFVIPGKNTREDILSMPGISRMSPDLLMHDIDEIVRLGIRGVLLFGIPAKKDAQGSLSYNKNGIVQETVRQIKDRYPELVVLTDVCLCSYTDHGHCGIVQNGRIINDASVDILARIALSHADAGADIVAPSDMMDGRVGAIRTALDRDGYEEVSIMSYAVKFASAFYGPFRDIADATPTFGDRKTYQMDYRNAQEALREASLDVSEGADSIIVKPALAYLDIIRKIADTISVPVAAYNVSGEYSMIRLAGREGILNEEDIIRETLVAFRRAGASIIISYFTRHIFEKGLI